MGSIPKNKIKSPIAVELTISENELKELKGKEINTDWLKASNIDNVKYGVAITICGPHQDNEGEAWIYLSLRFPVEMNIETDFCVTIESANYSNKSKDDTECDVSIGQRICTGDKLLDPANRYIVNGKMTIKMEGFLIIEKEEEKNTKWNCENYSGSLGIELWEQENKDFKIVVCEKEVAAHKCILSARSPVFAKMFESGMKEAQEGKVEIQDFSFEIVEMAIKILYHHTLVPYTSLEDKMKLLQFFDKYDNQKFKDKLETYLITVVNELTVCRLVNGALLSNATKLEEKCFEFLRRCLRKSTPIADFDILDKDFAMKLLKNAFCYVPKYETQVV